MGSRSLNINTLHFTFGIIDVTSDTTAGEIIFEFHSLWPEYSQKGATSEVMSYPKS